MSGAFTIKKLIMSAVDGEDADGDGAELAAGTNPLDEDRFHRQQGAVYG